MQVQLFEQLSTSSNVSSPSFSWRGGEGWLVVALSVAGSPFSGAAQLTMSGSTGSLVGGPVQVQFSQPVNTDGAFLFNAPAGTYAVNVNMGAGGSVSLLTAGVMTPDGSL
jgi:hypothetical protein